MSFITILFTGLPSYSPILFILIHSVHLCTATSAESVSIILKPYCSICNILTPSTNRAMYRSTINSRLSKFPPTVYYFHGIHGGNISYFENTSANRTFFIGSAKTFFSIQIMPFLHPLHKSSVFHLPSFVLQFQTASAFSGVSFSAVLAPQLSH